MKLSQEQEIEVIQLFTKGFLGCADIGRKFNVSTSTIWKTLRRNNIDTSKRDFPIKCHGCGKTFFIGRYRIRQSTNHFHNWECYLKWLRRNRTFAFGLNSTRARRIIRENVDRSNWPSTWVVHHIDGNCNNNDLSNLMVFRNQGDHIKYHREVPGIKPLWSGADLS